MQIDRARRGGGVRRGILFAIGLAALLALPLAAVPASAGRLRNEGPRYVPIVESGTTARFDGGEFVHIRVGDISLGAIWSSNATIGRGGGTLFVDYTRVFRGAGMVDDRGEYLRARALPPHTGFIHHFD